VNHLGGGPAGTRRGGPALWLLLALVVAGLVASFFLDPLVYETLSAKGDISGLESSDWYRFFRILGFLPTWVAIALALFAVDSARRTPHLQPIRRATLVLLAPAAAGLAAELLKLFFRRARPEHGGAFLTAGDGIFDGSGLAFPSSHAAVAFGGAFILSFLHPRAAPILLFLAACCGMTRIAAGDHHFSDVYAAMLLSYATARLLYAWDARNNALPAP
jgi:membrane-associated phospholipid phosphatase